MSTTPRKRRARPDPTGYIVYETDLIDNHMYMWLSIQHVSLTIPGHQIAGYSAQNSLASATYLLAVTIVASVNVWPTHTLGDYAAYVGIASPALNTDRQRVADIAAHGNKIDGALAEHLFRKALDRRFGKGVIRYRS